MENTVIWERYRAGKSYQQAMGFEVLFPQCIDFKEGRQWPEATKATRNLPRPVINICDKFVRTKRANVLNQSIKMVFSPAEGVGSQSDEVGARAYSDYAAALWKELGQDRLNEECLDDAATLGTGILHYYWDESVAGGSRYPFVGALRGEVLDPLTVLFGDPQETDVQAQPYIIIATRAPVRSVRAIARAEGMPEDRVALIVPDHERPDSYEASLRENREEEKCTLLTMYYRDGGVRFSRATKTVELISGRSLTPGLPDAKDEERDREQELPADVIDRYPLAVMQWNPRKRSIYGIGEIEGLIPAQKAINWLMGMNILSVQDTAWPKMVVKPGALQQEVTNTPGEIIEDHSVSGTGVTYLQPAGASSAAMSLVDKLNELMQYTSGVSEVVSGEPFTSTMAASAIIALQNQAKQPIESLQQRFYRTVEDVGWVWESFFKHYYTQPRPIAADGGQDGGTVLFIGSDFAAQEFRLEIDVGAGSVYSESLAQATLDKLFGAGQIDLDTYIELCPKNVMPFKEQLKRRIEQTRQQQMQMQQLAQAQAGQVQLAQQAGKGVTL